MKIALVAGAALSLLTMTPAVAATFVNVGDQGSFTFDGTVSGTSAELLLTLTGENNALSTFTFSYLLTNTSDALLTSRISGFGFNDNIAGGATATATGDFDVVDFGQNFPDGLGVREICVNGQTCLGGPTGATVGDPAQGSFTIDYAAANLTQLSLTDFAIHYISIGPNDLSGTGTGTEDEIPDPQGGVPEPSTWATMLLGFGAIGAAMRRRRSSPPRVRYSFT